MIGLGILPLRNSKALLISPILCLSLRLAVFLLYLLMGADLGLGLGPRLRGCFLRCSASILFWMEQALSLYDLSFLPY